METLLNPSAYADAAINKQLTNDDKVRLLREMFRIRRFEQTSLKYYNLGKMGGFVDPTREFSAWFF
jgi:pyruvate dehydrogenase E1 component alpha subunit